MLRFVFGATVQQLLADVMCWAHSLSRPSMSLTSGHAAPQAGRGDGELEEDAITALLHTTLQLPTFLAGMRHELHMAGCQLRFLASLPACRGACEALQRSAEQQVALLRTCSASGATEKPSAISGNASGGEGSERWRYSLAWDWDGAVRLVGAFASAQTERRALVQGLLDDLAAQRAAAEDEERAEALRAVQERQAQALAEEQGREAARIAHAERKLRLLREQQAALDDREHARRVRTAAAIEQLGREPPSRRTCPRVPLLLSARTSACRTLWSSSCRRSGGCCKRSRAPAWRRCCS